jgi:heterocycloanthracin/sonorensin family bacteriocin
MDDFKKDLQSLNVSEFKAGQVAPLQNQPPYDARLCVGIGGGFGGGCFGGGFGGGFRCHHHCGGCGGRCF